MWTMQDTGMVSRGWVFFLLAVGLLLVTALACGQEQRPQTAPTLSPFAKGETPTVMPTLPLPTATVTPTLVSATPTAVPTASPTPVALTEVQFALDVDETGQLIFPATEFVFGVTRIYVRFAYHGLADVTEVASVWYLNENPVVSGTLAWDGGEAGNYVMWMEDLNGVGRGQWRWELAAVRRAHDATDNTLLGGGTFTIGGAPRYVNAAWGLSFDPPASWKMESENEGFVTFSSPDQRGALALRVAPAATGLTETVATGLMETAANDLAVFQADRPEAEVVETEDVTMNGKKALLQQVHYTDQESGDQLLYIVSSLHAGSAYSLWMLGPAEQATTLRVLLIASLRSIRFSTE
jgi:hypothetical protein